MNIFKTALLAGLLASPAAIAQNEVLLTAESSKAGGSMVALDLVTDGNATAFEFTIPLPKGAKGVNTAKCLSELPKTHRGQCVFREKFSDVLVIAFSPTNAALPNGVLSLGVIGLPVSAKAIEVKDVVFAGSRGENLPAAEPRIAVPARERAEDGQSRRTR